MGFRNNVFKNSMILRNMLFLVIGALVLFMVGCADTGAPNGSPTKDTGTDISEDDLPPAPSPPETNILGPKYKGQILAGNEAPYIDFNDEDYQRAVADGKIILLYFYSLQSAPSIADQTAIHAAFNEMINPNIIGFRVNIDDENTSSIEEALASELGVKVSGTKLILKDGAILQRSGTKWNSNDYIRQLTQYLD